MLRAAIFLLCVGVVSACGNAADPVVGAVVRGDDGAVLGHVGAIERDGYGNIIAAEIEGLEPADAPEPGAEMVAEEDEPFWVRTSAAQNANRGAFTALR
jgi:hypothetical protein